MTDLERFNEIYGQYRAAVDGLPSLISDPQRHREGWERIKALHLLLEAMVPPADEPLPYEDLQTAIRQGRFDPLDLSSSRDDLERRRIEGDQWPPPRPSD